MNEADRQAYATEKQVDAFMQENKPRTLEDVYNNSIAKGRAILNDIGNRSNGTPLTVIDGDTVYDSETDTKFRLAGIDTAETTLNERARSIASNLGVDFNTMLNEGKKGKEALQRLVDTNSLTSSMLHGNASGFDDYGRTVTEVRGISNQLIAEGVAVPTNKLDAIGQELYRKAQQHKYEITGETNEAIRALRDSKLQGRGVVDYTTDVFKGVQASGVRVGSELLDLIADAVTIGNNEFFDKAKTSEGANKLVGLDGRHLQFDTDEIYHQYKTGDYTGALLTGLVAGNEVLASSSGDIAEIGLGLGWIAKGAKAVEIASTASKTLNAVKNISLNNAGLLAWASAKTNTDMEKRALNNDNGDVSFAEVGAGLVTNIAMGALDKVAFRRIVGGKQDYIDVVKTLQPSSISSFATKALTVAGGIVAKGAIEGSQEIIQETAEVLTHEYGTDKYPKYSSIFREENMKKVVTAGFMGTGMGLQMGSLPHVARGTYLGTEFLMEKLAKPYNSELRESMTEEEVTGLRVDNEQLKEVLTNNLNNNSRAMQDVRDNMDEEGNVDYGNLTTDLGRASVSSAYNRLNQEYIENIDEEEFINLKDNIYGKLSDVMVKGIIAKLKEGNYNIQEEIDEITPLFSNIHDKEIFVEQINGLSETYKVEDNESKRAFYNNAMQIIGATVDGDTRNVASYLTYANVSNNDMAITHDTNKFTSSLATQARVANSLLERGLKQTKAMDLILNSDTNKSTLPSTLSNMNTKDLDMKLMELIDANIDPSNISTEQYQLNKTNIEYITRIKNNRSRIEKDFGIKLRGSDTQGNIEATSKINEESLVNYIDAVNRGMLDKAYPDMDTTIKGIDTFIDSMLSIGSKLDTNTTATVRDFLRHVIDNGHTTNLGKAEALLEKMVLTSNEEYINSASTNIDAPIEVEQQQKLDSLDVDGVFEFTTNTTEELLTDEEIKSIAKKLGLADLLC